VGAHYHWGSEVVKDACLASDHGRIVYGLLARGGATDDGRAIVVCLTETGTALIDRALVIHARVVHEALIGKFLEKERAALLQTLSRSGYWPLLAALQTRPRQQVVDTGGQLAWPLWTPRHDLCDTYLHRTVADSASLDRTPPATAWGPSVGSNGEQSVADARRLQTARRPWRGVTDMGDAVRAVNSPRDRRSRPGGGV
jgi:hypothetical protein